VTPSTNLLRRQIPERIRVTGCSSFKWVATDKSRSPNKIIAVFKRDTRGAAGASPSVASQGACVTPMSGNQHMSKQFLFRQNRRSESYGAICD
jgi:hypothetical protein